MGRKNDRGKGKCLNRVKRMDLLWWDGVHQRGAV